MKNASIAATGFLSCLCLVLLVVLTNSNEPVDVSAVVGDHVGEGTGSGVVSPDLNPSAETELTEELRGWIGDWTQSPDAESVEEGRRIAESRAVAVKALIEADPDKALEQMLTYQEYHSLPVEISELIEQPFSVFAAVDAIPDCSFDSGAGNALVHFATWNGNRKRLYLPKERSNLLSKTRMPIAGYFIGDIAVLRKESAPVLRLDEAIAAAGLFGIEPVRTPANKLQALVGNQLWDQGHLAIVNRLQEAEKRYSPHSVSAALAFPQNSVAPRRQEFSVALDAVENEWTQSPKSILALRAIYADKTVDSIDSQESLEQKTREAMDLIEQFSYEKTSLGSLEVVSEVFTLPLSEEDYKDGDEFEYWRVSDAMREWANDQGYQVNDYDIVIYQFSRTSDAGFGGRASVGGQNQWINGRQGLYTNTHELGHNYGLRHASGWNTSDNTIMPAPGEALPEEPDEHIEYGDIFDVMGNPQGEQNVSLAHFHPYALDRLDWIEEEQILRLGTTSSEQTVRLYRFDHPDSDQNPLLLATLQFGESETVCIGHRRNFTANQSLSNGLYVSWAYSHTRTRLLDMNPSSSTDHSDMLDAGLQISESFTDPNDRITIEPLAQGGAGAEEWIDVRIRLGPVGNDPPSLDLDIPDNLPVREFRAFHANATDPENDTVSLEWNFGDTDEVITQSQPVFAYPIGGEFQIKVTASDGQGNYASSFADVHVSDPLEPWTTLELVEDIETSTVSGVDFVDEHFLIMSRDKIYKSRFGYHWEVFEPNIHILDADIGGGVMVVVGTTNEEETSENPSGQIEVSAEGQNWQRQTLPDNALVLYFVEFGADTWLAAGADGTLVRKSGSGDWESLEAPWSAVVENLIFHDGSFFIADSIGNLFRTDNNGDTWANITTEVGVEKIDRIGVGDGILLAVEGNTSFVSHDNGESWTSGAIGIPDLESFYLSYLACSSELHVIHGLDFREGLTAMTYYSKDGIKWIPFRHQTFRNEVDAAFGNTSLMIVEWSGQPRISNTVQPDFIRWMTSQFPDSDPSAFAPANDTDADGIPDFGEYAFGLNPSSPDRGITAGTYTLMNEVGFLIKARPIDPQVDFVCYLSTDLDTWTSVSLAFDRSRSSWSVDTDIIEVSSAIPSEDGLWDITIKKAAVVSECFVRFAATYDAQ